MHPGDQSWKTSTFLEDFGLHSRVDQRGRRERRSLGTLIFRRGKTSLSKTTNFGFLIGFVLFEEMWTARGRPREYLSSDVS